MYILFSDQGFRGEKFGYYVKGVRNLIVFLLGIARFGLIRGKTRLQERARFEVCVKAWNEFGEVENLEKTNMKLFGLILRSVLFEKQQAGEALVEMLCASN